MYGIGSADPWTALCVWLVWQLRREYSDARSRGVFRYSLTYLAALFAVLFADHLSWL